MDPETPSATEPAETPSATEPVVRHRPPRERHLPAHLTDYEVQLPPNLHTEPPPADSASQRPSRPSRHASRSISSGTVSSTSSRSHRSVQHRSPRHGLSDLQAAMLEERLKSLDLEELQQQIEEDTIVDKECERLDAQAREAQYRQEQATKARELLAKQESQDVNVPASQSSLAVDALSEMKSQAKCISTKAAAMYQTDMARSSKKDQQRTKPHKAAGTTYWKIFFSVVGFLDTWPSTSFYKKPHPTYDWILTLLVEQLSMSKLIERILRVILQTPQMLDICDCSSCSSFFPVTMRTEHS
ncbi:circadian locomoter output cycles kaput-like protein [Labeo rohita]|nr:circadian locomoter output cycles kaput-like protein [Labeo rohita]